MAEYARKWWPDNFGISGRNGPEYPNGESNRDEPILRKLDNIALHDALMNGDGTEYQWSESDYIIGNPPFLGNRRVRLELGDEYVERLRDLFNGRLPDGVDYVCYWFEKTRHVICEGSAERAGLLATNSIRGGANRSVLSRIRDCGGIFMAWSDEPWILDGAAVRVSIVGFDDGRDAGRTLNGAPVDDIYADLAAGLDLTRAQRLEANAGRAFQGTIKRGPFEISGDVARVWLDQPNPSGVSSRDVVRPWINGRDLTGARRDMWIIDFGLMSEDEASQYVVPFAHVAEVVKPLRMKGRGEHSAERWWLHHRPRPEMRGALEGLQAYIATPRVAKHRIFTLEDVSVVPDSRLYVIASEAYFDLGVLQSAIHETWTLATCSWHGAGNDPTYNAQSCFETFPFPRPGDDQRQEVAAWAAHLDQVRNQLLDANPKLTMTKLYNQLDELREDRDSTSRAYPLLVAHERLDAVVAAAYGWEWPLEEDEILTRLLALNLERAAEEEGREGVA